MAQRGRPRKTDSRPKPLTDPRPEFYCSRCRTAYPQQKGNFPYSQSTIYEGNNHYATLCKKCVDELYDHYVEILGSEMAATRRMCYKLDMYFSPKVFESTESATLTRSRMSEYASKLMLNQFKGKTFDTTLDEEYNSDVIEASGEIDKKTVQFFGEGFEASDYRFLQEQYSDWVSQYECKNKAQQELFKDLSFAQLNLVKAQRENDTRKVKEAMEAKQRAMQNQGITPLQRNDNTFADQQTFGTLLEKYENTRPLPEPNPEWVDVDGIIYFITVYFVGHICKMFGLKNKYSTMYEREMEKNRIKMQLEDEDDETAFETYFEAYIESRDGTSNEELGGDDDPDVKDTE